MIEVGHRIVRAVDLGHVLAGNEQGAAEGVQEGQLAGEILVEGVRLIRHGANGGTGRGQEPFQRAEPIRTLEWIRSDCH